MNLYLDADFILALIKPGDRLQQKAAAFWHRHSKQDFFFVSSTTLLEVWFVLYRLGAAAIFAEAMPDFKAMSLGLVEASLADFEAAALLSSKYGLSPADALHASLATGFDSIVSSDSCFDKVQGLKRIDFTS